MPPEERAVAAALPRGWTDALDRAPARRRIGSRIVFFEAAGSTNDIAARLAEEGETPGLAVIADTQTRGRGRLGRQWFSPLGSGLYVSLIVTPEEAVSEPERATRLLTLMAGVALAEAIERATGLSPSIKWPNDLLIGSRKLAGILAESVTPEVRLKPDTTYGHRLPEGESLRSSPRDAIAAGRVSGSLEPLRGAKTPSNSGGGGVPAAVNKGGAPRALVKVILGYGINVGLMSYPPELADRATSLEQELGRPFDRADIGAATLTALEARYGDLIGGRFDAILDAWRARAVGQKGGRVTWDTIEGLRHGIADGIDDWGALVVRTDRGLERLVAGEVRWDSF